MKGVKWRKKRRLLRSVWLVDVRLLVSRLRSNSVQRLKE